MKKRNASIVSWPVAGLPMYWQNYVKAWEVAAYAPQVIAHRLATMKAMGESPGAPDADDLAEINLMLHEKTQAAGEVMLALAPSMMRFGQQWTLTAMQTWWRMSMAMCVPFGKGMGGVLPAMTDGFSRMAAIGLSPGNRRSLAAAGAKGLAPVHRRVMANARRIASK